MAVPPCSPLALGSPMMLLQDPFLFLFRGPKTLVRETVMLLHRFVCLWYVDLHKS